MGKRILVIDDDEDILEILNILFQEEGFDVILSNTGESAQHIHTIKPDIVLLDIRILGSPKRGDEICAEIKAIYPHNPPVILISAELDTDLLAANCGADGWISKPFDLSHMIGKVKECLS
ncbi:response regulator [Mucilaginibacter endophyticus]|uniref:response regulator n=1 Tax=Mucilaginibacter endophyticus TaxID=2675003 RepID=UPI000E0DBC5B|nr:response regulator [Mucilaginibacter endophyticus]